MDVDHGGQCSGFRSRLDAVSDGFNDFSVNSPIGEVQIELFTLDQFMDSSGALNSGLSTGSCLSSCSSSSGGYMIPSEPNDHQYSQR